MKENSLSKVPKLSTYSAYKHSSVVPRDADIQSHRVFVDRKYEAVVLPVHGTPTPFHISTVKVRPVACKNTNGTFDVRCIFSFWGAGEKPNKKKCADVTVWARFQGGAKCYCYVLCPILFSLCIFSFSTEYQQERRG